MIFFFIKVASYMHFENNSKPFLWYTVLCHLSYNDLHICNTWVREPLINRNTKAQSTIGNSPAWPLNIQRIPPKKKVYDFVSV